MIAHVDSERDSAVLFLIHTELPKFIQDSSTLIKGVTKIEKADHGFLRYDSWIRFGEVHARPYKELRRQADEDVNCFCGYGSNALLARLIALIPHSPEIPPRWQQRYCEALTAAISIAS